MVQAMNGLLLNLTEVAEGVTVYPAFTAVSESFNFEGTLVKLDQMLASILLKFTDFRSVSVDSSIGITVEDYDASDSTTLVLTKHIVVKPDCTQSEPPAVVSVKLSRTNDLLLLKLDRAVWVTEASFPCSDVFEAVSVGLFGTGSYCSWNTEGIVVSLGMIHYLQLCAFFPPARHINMHYAIATTSAYTIAKHHSAFSSYTEHRTHTHPTAPHCTTLHHTAPHCTTPHTTGMDSRVFVATALFIKRNNIIKRCTNSLSSLSPQSVKVSFVLPCIFSGCWLC
jgi:hypothetical protein